jgi:hypothetical protein
MHGLQPRAVGRAFLLWTVLALFFASVAAAQTVPDDGANIRISILTMGPGDASWEKFGHIAVRIQDPEMRYPDVAFNWGIFEFDGPKFYWHFLQGRLIYSIGVYDGPGTIDSYEKNNRSVYEQVLHLGAAQKLEFERLCYDAVRPENCHYRYDYYRDNCSTRVRDLVDTVIGGALRRQTENVPTDHTYRSQTRRLVADDIPLYVALQAVLAQPTDRPLSAWDDMFLPEVFRQRLRDVTVVDASGRRLPLVESETVLSQSDRAPLRASPPHSIPPALIASLLIGGLFVLLTELLLRGKGGAWVRWSLLLFGWAWLLIIGLGGFIIAWAWFCTDHQICRHNENLLHISPLALILVWMLRKALRGGRRGPFIVAAMMAGLSLLGLALKVTPFFFQVNGDMIALCLAAHLALCWSMWRLSRRRLAVSAEAPAESNGPGRLPEPRRRKKQTVR